MALSGGAKVAILVVLVLILAGVTYGFMHNKPSGGPQCSSNSDCPSGQICTPTSSGAVCLPNTQRPCTTAADCNTGETCTGGYCQSAATNVCKTSADCNGDLCNLQAGGVCQCSNGHTGAHCEIPPPPIAQCDATNCGAGGACTSGMCICKPGWTSSGVGNVLCDTCASGRGPPGNCTFYDPGGRVLMSTAATKNDYTSTETTMNQFCSNEFTTGSLWQNGCTNSGGLGTERRQLCLVPAWMPSPGWVAPGCSRGSWNGSIPKAA